MKKGDKILCKKSLKIIGIINKKNYFTKGVYYTIDGVYRNSNNEIMVDIYNDNFGMSFIHTKYNDDYHCLCDYFYTEQELRKDKLKKLNRYVK